MQLRDSASVAMEVYCHKRAAVCQFYIDSYIDSFPRWLARPGADVFMFIFSTTALFATKFYSIVGRGGREGGMVCTV